MENSVAERIKIIMNELGENQNSFSKKIGVTPSTIATAFERNKGVNTDLIQKISNVFTNISVEWLLLNKGSMIKEDNEKTKASLISYKESKEAIPLVNKFVVAGFGSADFKIEKSDVKAYYIIPKFKDLHIDFMIEIAGASMQPTYNSGDVIACTIIRESRFIQWNRVHVIATKEQGLLVKRIQEEENEERTLLAVSDNSDYKPFKIPLDEITGLALVVGIIRLE